MYLKSQQWAEKRDNKLSQEREIKEKNREEFTFKPMIKPMVSEAAILQETSDRQS